MKPKEGKESKNLKTHSLVKQLGGIGTLLAMCLFFLGLLLMILIVARYVP